MSAPDPSHRYLDVPEPIDQNDGEPELPAAAPAPRPGARPGREAEGEPTWQAADYDLAGIHGVVADPERDEPLVASVQGAAAELAIEPEVLREGVRRLQAEATRLGLTVETLPPDVAKEASLSGGVRVRAVKPLSDGARAGIRRGDIILKINRKPVDDVKSYRRIVKELEAGEPVAIRVWRGDRTLTAEIERLSE